MMLLLRQNFGNRRVIQIISDDSGMATTGATDLLRLQNSGTRIAPAKTKGGPVRLFFVEALKILARLPNRVVGADLPIFSQCQFTCINKANSNIQGMTIDFVYNGVTLSSMSD
jgi:hypothetical protein